MKFGTLIVIVAIASIAVGLGAQQGLAYMRSNYDGACTQLGGFPGLLQKLNLLSLGNCQVQKNGNCDGNKAICTVHSASHSVQGVCRNRPHVGCQCVVD